MDLDLPGRRPQAGGGLLSSSSLRRALRRWLPPAAIRLAQRALGVGEFDRSRPFNRIPGMLGTSERDNLYRVCRDELRGAGAAVEFGAFLGASTAAIQAGLKANPRLAAARPALHVYDVFRTPAGSEFARLVREYAARNGNAGLLVEQDGWLDFQPVFAANVPADAALRVHREPVDALRWDGGAVEFLHLDLPKDWLQLQPIATQVLPQLVPDARVLLQDFVYHWSAELIAATGFLLGGGQLEAERVTATTLTCRVAAPITQGQVARLAALMRDPAAVASAIDGAIAATAGHLDAEQRARMLLAKAQYLHERVSSDAGEAVLAALRATARGGTLDAVAPALQELVDCRMKLPKSWG